MKTENNKTLKTAGINGFGRFGLHLLKYYLDRKNKSSFEIKYINDDNLKIDKVLDIIKNDTYVIFKRYKIKKNRKYYSFHKI